MRFLLKYGLLLMLAIRGICLFAEDKSSTTAVDKVKTLIEETTLDAPGIRPWHWKMDVTVFDIHGMNPQSGSIEAWFADGNMRTVMRLGDQQLTTLRLGDKLFRTEGDSAKFAPLEIVFMNAMHPVPEVLLQHSVKLAFLPVVVGKSQLDCIQPTLAKSSGTVVSGTPLSFCMVPGTDQYVAAYLPCITSIVRAQIGNFQSKQVPMSMEITVLQYKRAELKTTALSTFTPSANDFVVSQDMHQLENPVLVLPQNVLVGQLLGGNESIDFKRHTHGTVKFDTVIGIDGMIRSTSNISDKVDKDVANEFDRWISRWTYRPYLLNGLAVQVRTIISINFESQ